MAAMKFLNADDRARFAEHASAEAIAEHLAEARATAAAVARYAAWVERLATRRAGQIEAGTWPPPVRHRAGRARPPADRGRS